MAEIAVHWWRLPRPCSNCGATLVQINDIMWARNGDIKIVGTCSNCDTVMQYDTDHNLVLEFCMNKDWCKHYVEQIKKIEEPKKLLNSKDEQFLKDFHIEGGIDGT